MGIPGVLVVARAYIYSEDKCSSLCQSRICAIPRGPAGDTLSGCWFIVMVLVEFAYTMGRQIVPDLSFAVP
jgi:hypothetical protein